MGGRVSNLPEQTMLEMVEDLQKQMRDTDRSVAGLAKSIDSMQAVSQMLLLHLDKKPDTQNVSDTSQDVGNTSKDQNQTVSGMASQLLLSIEENVTDNKYIALQNVGKLLQSLVNGLLENNCSGSESLDKEKFAIHRYLATKSPKQSTDKGSYYDEKIQSLHFEIDKLKEIVRSQGRQIVILNEKENDLLKEKQCLQQQVLKLEDEAAGKKDETRENQNTETNGKSVESSRFNDMKNNSNDETNSFNMSLKGLSEEDKVKELALIKTNLESEKKKHGEVIDKLQKLQEEKETLEHRYQSVVNELDSFKNRRGISISLQWYRQYPRQLIDSIIIEKLKTTADIKSIRLEAVRRNIRQDIKPDKLALIFCEYREDASIKTVLKDAVKDISVSSKVGIVVLHQKNSKNIREENSFFVKDYALERIFYIACNFFTDLRKCEENDTTFEEIVKFISKEGAC